MADKKISALTAASTPLAGTEVLPIVQSGATVKVAVSDLTAGRAISATAVTASTGNFVVGTSGNGIDFSATPGTGTSELLADYEEGTWTPVGTFVTQGSATSSFTGTYTKVGRQVTIVASGSVNKGTASGAFTITGVPYATATTAAVAIRTAGIGAVLTVLQANLESGTGTVIKFLLAPQSTSLAGASPTAADMNNPDNYIQLSCTYSI